MKRFSFVLAIFIIAYIFTSCGGAVNYTVKEQKDANGFTYKTVTNDPAKARIYTLDNGLTVYLSVNKDEPRIQTYIPVKAGSTYDPAETTGLAHYLEHMMFKGTSKFGTKDWSKESVLLEQISNLYEQHKAATTKEEKTKIYAEIDRLSQEASKLAIANEYDKLCSIIGAKGTNAYTSNERTVYENDIPANELEKWLKIESERFSNLVLRLFHTEIEAVYEEFNMSQDNDGRKAYYQLMAGLWPTHKYGQQTTLGKGEHLKNPSMLNIHKYFDTYYVPNNMAICLSGDLDFEKTIQLINKYWGGFKKGDVPANIGAKEEPIKEVKEYSVYGPNDEYVMFGYRFNGYASEDRRMVTMIDMILSNSQAGLIDLNLNQQQAVLGAGCSPSFMKDYGMHLFSGSPRAGQTLEEVKDLILAQIEKVKKGEFPDWLVDAVVKDMQLSEIKNFEGNGRADSFVNAFALGLKWENYISFTEGLKTITKEQIVKFANENYVNNYVVVYKRKGVDKNVMKVDKPKITPVPINREDRSEFLTNIVNEKVETLKPDFIDFNEKIKKEELQKGLDIEYIKNEDNKLFKLYYIFDMGKKHSKELALAIGYAQYLGTDKYTPAELQQEFYKNGLSINVNAGSDYSTVSISGLGESLESGISLMEHIISNAKADEIAYKNYVAGILKSRSNALLNKSAIMNAGLYNYAKYGSVNPNTDILSEKELNAINPADLVKMLAELTTYKHRIFYYGNEKISKLKSILKKHHTLPTELKEIPAPIEYPELAIDKNIVYFVNYEMVQANIMMLAKKNKFDKEQLPTTTLFNEYFGGGMGSIVFQEIRESKALAYSAWSSFSTASKKENSNYILGYVATQADKLKLATDGLLELLNNMPRDDKAFENARTAIQKKIESERITKDAIYWTYYSNRDRGIDYDYRKGVYELAQKASFADLDKFFNENVKDSKYVFLVVGNRKLVNMETLKKLGTVKELSLKDIFGYEK